MLWFDKWNVLSCRSTNGVKGNKWLITVENSNPNHLQLRL